VRAVLKSTTARD